MRIFTSLILIAAGLAAWPPPAVAADAVYLYGTDASGQPRRPWGVNTNEKAMTVVFGEWSVAHYNDEGLAAILASRFAYLEGGDASANQLAAFLDANRAALEAWVKAGGRLLIVAAPNQGGNFPALFGTTLNYARHAYVADAGHAIFRYDQGLVLFGGMAPDTMYGEPTGHTLRENMIAYAAGMTLAPGAPPAE